jgi:hypothetical protein
MAEIPSYKEMFASNMIYLTHLLHQINGAGGRVDVGGAVLHQVLLVAHDQHGHISHVSTLGHLLAHRADVLETVRVGQVVDEHVGGGRAEAVEAVVGPFAERVVRKVRDDGNVGDFQLVQVPVDDDRGVVRRFVLRRGVLLFELVPNELLHKENYFWERFIKKAIKTLYK